MSLVLRIRICSDSDANAGYALTLSAMEIMAWPSQESPAPPEHRIDLTASRCNLGEFARSPLAVWVAFCNYPDRTFSSIQTNLRTEERLPIGRRKIKCTLGLHWISEIDDLYAPNVVVFIHGMIHLHLNRCLTPIFDHWWQRHVR